MDDGDRRISSDGSIKATASPARSPGGLGSPERHAQNIKTAQVVSQNLLQSFKVSLISHLLIIIARLLVSTFLLHLSNPIGVGQCEQFCV